MKATVTSKGQITIPAAIRHKLGLTTGAVLNFDEQADHLKATKVADINRMRSAIGIARHALARKSTAAWVDELRGPWTELAAQVREHVREFHPRQYKQISKEDPELLPRTEKLAAEDAAIEEDAEEFERMLHRFAEHAPKFEPDEEKIAKHLKMMVDDGVEFVTRVRKQEAAVQAWFLEAFTRDRGVAD